MVIYKLYGLFISLISKLLKSGIGLVAFLKLKTGLYRKVPLPDYDFDSLKALWPYKPPYCVSNAFSRKEEADIDLSICIPAFNAEKTILTLLEQIERQKTNYKIEVLIVNDGSTDKTGELIGRFVAGRENYHLYHQGNAGLSAARNKAIDNSSGRYLTFIDSDDEICDGFIESLMSAATTNDADIVRGQYYSRHGSHIRLCGIVSSFAWGKVYRASLFDKIRFPEGYWFEDMINSFLLTTLSEKTVDISVPVIIHNYVEGSLSKVQLSAVTYRSLEQLYLVMSLIEDYKTLGLTDEAYLHKRILHECSRLMVRRTERLDEVTKKQVFLACNKIFEENGIKAVEFSGVDRLFADSIINKDYVAWKMAADYAVVYNRFFDIRAYDQSKERLSPTTHYSTRYKEMP